MKTFIPHFDSVDITPGDGENAIFIIGVRPTDKTIQYLEQLQEVYKKTDVKYDVFFICDDDGKPYMHPTLNIMQVSHMECAAAGFQHMIMFGGTVPHDRHVCAWDKAMYIASKIRPYKHYWFVEDDVFISKLDLFHLIDRNTDKYDLIIKALCHGFFGHAPYHAHVLKNRWAPHPKGGSVVRKIGPDMDPEELKVWRSLERTREDVCIPLANEGKMKESMNEYQKLYHNSGFEFFTPHPHFNALSCCLRFSHKLLKISQTYASRYGELFMQEWFFGTIAYNHNLSILFDGLRSAHYREAIEQVKLYRNNPHIYFTEDVLGGPIFDMLYARGHINNPQKRDEWLQDPNNQGKDIVAAVKSHHFPEDRMTMGAYRIFHSIKDIGVQLSLRRALENWKKSDHDFTLDL